MNCNNFQLLLYFDKKHILLEMKTSICDYLDQLNGTTIFNFPPLRFLLKLDFMDLCNEFPELGEFFLAEPLKFNEICNEILFACLKSCENEYTQYVQASQVAVTIRPKSLPPVLSRSTTRSRYENIVTFYGLLLTNTKPTSDVFHSVWSCPEECEGNEVIILHKIPKVSPKCSLCKSSMFENIGLRECGERVVATFKLKNTLLYKKFIIKDELIPLLKLGSTYLIHTVVLKTAAVWSLEEHVTLSAPMTFPTPLEIEKLFAACGGCPWKFFYCMASRIGVNVCPLNCFMNVKMNLLLSLSSVKAHSYTGTPIIHFLASGLNTGFVAELMTQASMLADRKIIFGVSNNTVETALTASSGGVCVMPLPIQVYSQQLNKLLFAMEKGDINVEVGNGKLKCAVWAQGHDFKKITLFNVGRVFGLVSRGDVGDVDMLTDFILERAIEPAETINEEIEALKTLSNYIDLVAGYTVNVSEETENLLRNYFLAARKASPVAVTGKSMEALVAVCVTSARLCRRTVTNIEDAVFAIWLHVSGLPRPGFAPDEYLNTSPSFREFGKSMNQFMGWLEQFSDTVL